MASKKNNELIEFIRGFCQQSPPSSFICYRKYFRAMIAAAKEKGLYSTLHKFSDALGFGHTTYLHLIIKNHRSLTAEKAKLFSTKYIEDSVERRYYKYLVAYGNSDNPEEREKFLLKMMEIKDSKVKNPSQAFWNRYVSHWYLPVLKEVLENYDLDSVGKLSSHMNLSVKPKEVENAIKILSEIGVLETDGETGKFKIKQSVLSTGSSASGISMRKFQNEMLQQSQNALNILPGEQRDFSFITVKAAETDFKFIKAKIHELQNILLELGHKPSKGSQQIFQVNIQMYPHLKQAAKGIASEPQGDDELEE